MALSRTSVRSACSLGRISTPAFSASTRRASPKLRPSLRITKEKASPPVAQAPKQRQLCLWGSTTKEGVFSVWNGHVALKVRPDFFRGT